MRISAKITKLLIEYLRETAITLRAQEEHLKSRSRTNRTPKKGARRRRRANINIESKRSDFKCQKKKAVRSKKV